MPKRPDPIPASAPHRVVWQVPGGEPAMLQQVGRQVANLLADLEAEGVDVEVVTHGPGLDLLLPGGPAAEAVGQLQERGVVFLACENTLRSRDLEGGDLLAGVRTVPSGVGAVVRRQSQGWGYLRA